MSTHTYATRTAADLTVTGTGVLTRLTGRAVPYDTPTDIGRFIEEIAPGMFAASLAATPNLPLHVFHGDVPGQSHTTPWPVGVATDWDDRRDGLYGLWRFDDTPEAQHTARRVEAGMLPFLSIRFQPDELAGRWTVRRGFKDRVRWTRGRLVSVSLVSSPAYPGAVVTDVRSTSGGDPAADAFGLVCALAADLGDDLVRSAITGTPADMQAAAGLVRLAVEEHGADSAPAMLHELAEACRHRNPGLAVNLARAASCVARGRVDPVLRDSHVNTYLRAVGRPALGAPTPVPARRRRNR